eukprot:CAMPEP_0204860764 /NCGR_PEP_ID=MMETSP1348-20121228/831_1 /ASSEMBLY_ACC=CAM_ASM_000700 /TAXON_ID=215587 /ORGANISM="Aplanochytrium stocchinoi, Strain GSBS06" /LENGTH=633 /DNA_ID=CAMNT_0052009691 /DNA_START=209 /DNA_END=2111 /DNA_ORIENTATION=-
MSLSTRISGLEDGPYGTGACICQYGKWDICGVENPIVPLKLSYTDDEQLKLKTLMFENSAIFNILRLSKVTSRKPTQIRDALATNVLPQPFKKSKLLYFDLHLAHRLELDIDSIETIKNLEKGLAGVNLFPGSQPFSASYGGHQFAEYSGQLGDGRVVNLGQLHFNLHGELATFEVALKGAGRTPFSRAGDGRSTLKSSLRELMGSVYLRAIGIPTVEVLAITESCEDTLLYRDTWYNSTIEKYIPGIVARIGPTFLRFGTVQIAAKRLGLSTVISIAKEALRVTQKLDEDNNNHYWGITNPESDVCDVSNDLSNTEMLSCLLKKVSARLAVLIASWMSSGFVHGIMNTDNMSLVGLTLDLNVFGWISNWNETYTPNFIDTEGRYAFGRQPEIALWNLQRLADALSGSRYTADSEYDASSWMDNGEEWLPTSVASSIVENFLPTYRKTFYDMMKNRLGLGQIQGSDLESIVDKFLQVAKFADYHILSRRILELQDIEYVSDDSSFQAWSEKTISDSGLDVHHQRKFEEVADSIRRVTINHTSRTSSLQRKSVPNIMFRSAVIDKVLSQLTHVDDNNKCDSSKRKEYLEDIIQVLSHPYDVIPVGAGGIVEDLSTVISSLPYKSENFLSSCGAQ